MTENENIELAELLFGEEELKTREEYEEMYPYRKLGNKSEVTRLAPSPTGFMHLGNLYSALADERIAHTKEGVFFLRIEDKQVLFTKFIGTFSFPEMFIINKLLFFLLFVSCSL